VILIIFIVAAVLTPPDIISQILMALPLLALYEASIWVARIFGKRPKAKGKKKKVRKNR
jgi:sec-independent protein translocase protein TatC